MQDTHYITRAFPRSSRRPQRLARALSLPLLLCLETAAASTAQPGATAAATSGGIGQMVIGLAAVLGLILAIAWLLKRFPAVSGPRSGPVRIIGGAALGQRERIVVVEVGGTWLLIGVAPGQVRTLHTMPKNDTAAPPDAPPEKLPPANPGFAGWLQRVMERRSHE